MKKVSSYVVSDCQDKNAVSRYTAAFERELGGSVYCYGSVNALEATGMALDIVDEMKGKDGVVFVNIAPRSNEVAGEGHKNGRPFLYFFHKKTLVIVSSEKEILQFLKHAGVDLIDLREIDLFSIKQVPSYTQFRSAQCVPIVARLILEKKYKGEKVFAKYDKLFDLQNASEKIKNRVWFIDNFGNCKTTNFEFSATGLFKNATPTERLADVKDRVAAQTKGSSGFGENRFVELVLGGGYSFAKKYRIDIGKVQIYQ
jgi:hypothetical protein